MNKPEWVPVFTGLSVPQFNKLVRIVARRGGAAIAEHVAEKALQHTADGRFRRWSATGTQPGQHTGGGVGGPLGDRGERACPGHCGCQRDGQHRCQAMSHSSAFARVGHSGQHLQQSHESWHYGAGVRGRRGQVRTCLGRGVRGRR